jgi:RNA polymerase sigma factor (sigma-70 family)
LVRLAQKGDMEAFEELVARHRDKVYARAYSMMRNEDEALDLSQDAWVKGWQRLGQFQGDSTFSTWMTRDCHQPLLDQLRKLKRKRAESLEAMEEESGGVERQMPVTRPIRPKGWNGPSCGCGSTARWGFCRRSTAPCWSCMNLSKWNIRRSPDR